MIGKHRAEVAQNLRCVGDGILREQKRRERVVLKPFARRRFVERAIDGEHAADAFELETHAELNGLKVLGSDKNDKRIARSAVWQFRAQEAERLHRDLAGDPEL